MMLCGAWRAKLRVPCERAYKTVSATAVKSDPAFCLGQSCFYKKKQRETIALVARPVEHCDSSSSPFQVGDVFPLSI